MLDRTTPPIDPLFLRAALATAEECARCAGALVFDWFSRPRRLQYKGPRDIVTAVDRKSEKLIRKILTEQYPDHHIVGEEEGGSGADRDTAPYRWYVDPIDGTSNFGHGVPRFCISVAMAGADDLPLIGVIYDPMLEECFKAIRGGGATRNGTMISVSTIKSLDRAMVASGFPTDRGTNPDNNTETFSAMATRAGTIRCNGSSALDLAYVAAGRLDGSWLPRVNPWDVMAGLLLVSEAGGQITNYRGGQDEAIFQGKQIVVSNGLIHDDMLTVIVLGHAAPKPKTRKR